jgi:two-component system, NtrC family, C4-dicarboxylate transport response regulator DctD
MSTELPVVFIDDDDDIRRATAQMLELSGFTARIFPSAKQALSEISGSFPGVVATDIRMPDMNGLQLFEHVRAIDPELPVILITGHGDIDLAVAAMKDGAYDFITKPFIAGRLTEALRRGIEKRALVLQNRSLHRAIAEASSEDGAFLGDAPSMSRLRKTLRQIADTDVDVLVEGETGTGKDVVAQLLHSWSRRCSRAFVALNCGALPEHMIESELFGHEAGAFTGAKSRRIGRIEHSSGGTLFLDEIESMPAAAQVKLLRVLETRQIEPLGTNQTRRLNLRVIAATKIDLAGPRARESFRQDLYFRLNVVRLRIPPLRDRRQDIPLLFAHFLKHAAQRFGRPIPELSRATRDHLEYHTWPGNVRELLHFAQRIALGLEAEKAESPTEESGVETEKGSSDLSLADRVNRFEASVIRATLRDEDGDLRRVLEALQLPRKTFYDKLKRHGISRNDYDE